MGFQNWAAASLASILLFSLIPLSHAQLPGNTLACNGAQVFEPNSGFNLGKAAAQVSATKFALTSPTSDGGGGAPNRGEVRIFQYTDIVTPPTPRCSFTQALAGQSSIPGDKFGISISPLLPGHLLVGAVGGVNQPGRVNLFTNQGIPVGSGTLQHPSPLIGANFGDYVLTGNIDGDAALEVIVGSPGTDEIFVYDFNGSSFSPVPGSPIQAGSHNAFNPNFGSSGTEYGRSFALVGDIGGTPSSELVVGAPTGGPNGEGCFGVVTWNGSSLQVFNSGQKDFCVDSALLPLPSPTVSPYPTPPSPQIMSFGEKIAAIGDVDVDGVPDVAISAPLFSEATESNVGRILLVSLQPGAATPPTVLPDDLRGLHAGTFFGKSLSAVASPASGGTRTVMAIGAPGAEFPNPSVIPTPTPGTVRAGLVATVELLPLPNGVPLSRVKLGLALGGAPGDELGSSSQLVPSLNPAVDSRPDLLVGVPRTASPGRGEGLVALTPNLDLQRPFGVVSAVSGSTFCGTQPGVPFNLTVSTPITSAHPSGQPYKNGNVFFNVANVQAKPYDRTVIFYWGRPISPMQLIAPTAQPCLLFNNLSYMQPVTLPAGQTSLPTPHAFFIPDIEAITWIDNLVIAGAAIYDNPPNGNGLFEVAAELSISVGQN